MDNKTQQAEKSIELRSEKVRNIVGQIPSLLIRQGILIIGLVLLLLLGISAFIPYKKTLPITVTIHQVPSIEKIYAPTDGIFLIDTVLKQVKPNHIVGNLAVNDTLLPVKANTLGKIIWNVQNNDFVKKKDLLFIIVPSKLQVVYGECSVHLSQKATLQKGQKVELLDDFGQRFYGQIDMIYTIPSKMNTFKVKVKINQNTSNALTQKMTGQIIIPRNLFFI